MFIIIFFLMWFLYNHSFKLFFYLSTFQIFFNFHNFAKKKIVKSKKPQFYFWQMLEDQYQWFHISLPNFLISFIPKQSIFLSSSESTSKLKKRTTHILFLYRHGTRTTKSTRTTTTKTSWTTNKSTKVLNKQIQKQIHYST